MTDKSELLDCPFCGGSELGTTWTRVTDDVKWAGILCSDCQVELSRETKSEAIAAWNTRASLRTQPSVVEGDTAQMQASRIAEMIAEVNQDGACMIGKNDLGDLRAAYSALAAQPRDGEREGGVK